MKTTFRKEEPNRGIIEVSIPTDELTKAVDKKIVDLARTTSIKGFRPGKAPKQLVAKMYGPQVRLDTLYTLASDGLFECIKKEDLTFIGQPIGQTSIDPEKEADSYELVYHLALSPQFDIALDNSLEMVDYMISVSDEQVETLHQQNCQRLGEMIEVEKQMGERDSFTGKLTELDAEGQPLEEGIVKEDANFFPFAFSDEEQKALFKDAKVGDTIRFNPWLAEGENPKVVAMALGIDASETEEHKGDFSFEISGIKHYQEAELGEELYKKLFGDETAINDEASYRKELAQMIAKQNEGQALQYFERTLLDTLLDKAMEQAVYDDETLRALITTNGQEKKEWSDEELDKQLKGLKRYLTYTAMLNKLAAQENIAVTDEKIHKAAEARVIAQLYQYGLSPQQIPADLVDSLRDKMLEEGDKREELTTAILAEEIVGIAREKITLKKEEISAEQFNDLVAKLSE